MSFPPPDATYSEIQAWEKAKAETPKPRKGANWSQRRCSNCNERGHHKGKCPRLMPCLSCGVRGHLLGSTICGNYRTPWRHHTNGKLWSER